MGTGAILLVPLRLGVGLRRDRRDLRGYIVLGQAVLSGADEAVLDVPVVRPKFVVDCFGRGNVCLRPLRFSRRRSDHSSPALVPLTDALLELQAIAINLANIE